MNKKTLILLVSLLLSGCLTYQPAKDIANSDSSACPQVVIRPQDKSIIQTASHQRIFKIEIVGYSGHCYFDERIGKNKAVVAPSFKITRLNESNVEDVHFSYYLETAEGPSRFLGKKTYFTQARIAKGQYEAYHNAQSGELSIPYAQGNVDIYTGLYAQKADSEYKNN